MLLTCVLAAVGPAGTEHSSLVQEGVTHVEMMTKEDVAANFTVALHDEVCVAAQLVLVAAVASHTRALCRRRASERGCVGGWGLWEG